MPTPLRTRIASRIVRRSLWSAPASPLPLTVVVDGKLDVELRLDHRQHVADGALLVALLLAALTAFSRSARKSPPAGSVGEAIGWCRRAAPRFSGPGAPPGHLLQADEVGLALLDLGRDRRGADRRELGRVDLVDDLAARVDGLIDRCLPAAPGSDPRPGRGCGSSPSSFVPLPSSFPRRRRRLGSAQGRGPQSAPRPAPSPSAPSSPGTDMRDSTELLSPRFPATHRYARAPSLLLSAVLTTLLHAELRGKPGARSTQ